MLPADLRRILPDDTADTWETIAPAVPSSAYLAGGTGIAVHLLHRASLDLDFFYHRQSVDLDEMSRALSDLGNFVVTDRSPGTLNGTFLKTKIQFLHADEAAPQTVLDPPTETAGIMVAGLRDLMAMKLKVVGDRGELRDYLDLMILETSAAVTVEAGLSWVLKRYHPPSPNTALGHIIRGLGWFDDVDDDRNLSVPRREIVEYWTRRQPEILSSLEKF